VLGVGSEEKFKSEQGYYSIKAVIASGAKQSRAAKRLHCSDPGGNCTDYFPIAAAIACQI
jgi:hypothetical protein